MGETLDSGRDAEIQHKLVTGCRFRGMKWNAFIFHIHIVCACLYRWFRVDVCLYLCSYFFFCKTSLKGCCPRHMRLRSSWMVLSGTLKPQTAAYIQCLMTSSCCPTHSSLKMYVNFFMILAKWEFTLYVDAKQSSSSFTNWNITLVMREYVREFVSLWYLYISNVPPLRLKMAQLWILYSAFFLAHVSEIVKLDKEQ